MKRFYFGDDEQEDENDDDFDESKFIMPDAAELIAMTQFENPDQYLLSYSIRICERSFFWRFLNIDSKLNMIDKAFNNLKKITEGQNNASL
jgi:hypothetical protein